MRATPACNKDSAELNVQIVIDGVSSNALLLDGGTHHCLQVLHEACSCLRGTLAGVLLLNLLHLLVLSPLFCGLLWDAQKRRGTGILLAVRPFLLRFDVVLRLNTEGECERFEWVDVMDHTRHVKRPAACKLTLLLANSSNPFSLLTSVLDSMAVYCRAGDEGRRATTKRNGERDLAV